MKQACSVSEEQRALVQHARDHALVVFAPRYVLHTFCSFYQRHILVLACHDEQILGLNGGVCSCNALRVIHYHDSSRGKSDVEAKMELEVF